VPRQGLLCKIAEYFRRAKAPNACKMRTLL
jgi:hypothetical protein